MKERQRDHFHSSVDVQPGDELHCTVTDRKTGKRHRFVDKIGRRLKIDTIVTFDAEPGDFGLKDGIGTVFGEQA